MYCLLCLPIKVAKARVLQLRTPSNVFDQMFVVIVRQKQNVMSDGEGKWISLAAQA
jgi:hypothetical protein